MSDTKPVAADRGGQKEEENKAAVDAHLFAVPMFPREYHRVER